VNKKYQINFDVISQTCNVIPTEISHVGNPQEKIKKLKIVAYH
jgi:hypothetical protein